MNKDILLVVTACLLFTACCSSCVYGIVNTKHDSLSSYIEELESKITQLSCTQEMLKNVVYALSVNNSTLTGEIISKRQKQLQIINKALESLILENSILKTSLANINTSPIDIVTLTDGAFMFSDGSRARSCNEYLNPSYPYQYGNQGNGLYNIEPTPGKYMTVYCDMTSDGGGWTLISGIQYDYEGIHFHTFEDSSACSSSNISSFHLETSSLLNISTQIRAATDSSSTPISSFYLSNWEFSGACNITSALRDAIQNTPTENNGDLPASCFIISGLAQTPSHFTYGNRLVLEWVFPTAIVVDI